MTTTDPRELVLTRLIDVPREKLWRCWTEPELMKKWFAPLPYTTPVVELDLRPGGAAVFHWSDYGPVNGRVEEVVPPRFFSFRWVVPRAPGAEVAEDNSTLVEFSLSANGDSTRLTVVESGFRDLVESDDEKQRYHDSHRRGWEKELGELSEYVAQGRG